MGQLALPNIIDLRYHVKACPFFTSSFKRVLLPIMLILRHCKPLLARQGLLSCVRNRGWICARRLPVAWGECTPQCIVNSCEIFFVRSHACTVFWSEFASGVASL